MKKTKLVLIVILITILVLVLLSSSMCENWTQSLTQTSPDTCYDTMEACNSGCTGWRFSNGTCVAGLSCNPGENCYSTQEGCLGNNVKGYRCAENCMEGAVCGSKSTDNWDNCHGSRQNCIDSCSGYRCTDNCNKGAPCTEQEIREGKCYQSPIPCKASCDGYRCSQDCNVGGTCSDGEVGCFFDKNYCLNTCPGYRYINNVCTVGAKCNTGEQNCYLREDTCRSSPSSVSYKSLGSRCFNSGYNCGSPGLGMTVKYTFTPSLVTTSGLRVKVPGDTLTVYGTVVGIDNTSTTKTVKIMPDVIQSNGPSSADLPGGTYYWGRNTWYTKNQDALYLPRYFGTYANPISNSTLPNDPQLAPLANVKVSDLTLANIPDVLL